MEKNIIKKMTLPEYVYIPMAQNYKSHCLPFVEAGEHVKAGQPIGYTSSTIGAPIYASVSGEIVAIESNSEIEGADNTVIVIKSDDKQEIWDGIKKPIVNDLASFIVAIKTSGMIGLEGASLGTHTKFDSKTIDNVNTLIVNGAEWTLWSNFEKEIMTADIKKLLDGIQLTMKYMGLQECFIGIKDDMKQEIKQMTTEILAKNINNVKVIPLPQSCPQGSDRVLIYETTGEIIGPKNLPEDFGYVVANLASLALLGEYVDTGMPLTKRMISVEGDAMKTATDVIAPIGAKISDIVSFCGGYKVPPKKIVIGGPTLRRPLENDNVPLAKDNNSIMAFTETNIANIDDEESCKDCTRCDGVCPINLSPKALYEAFNDGNIQKLAVLGLSKCTECGRCSFVCPARKPLSFMIEQAKMLIANPS